MKALRKVGARGEQKLKPEEILERSSVLREFRSEKQEINKLRWIESEKLGEDIGYQKALLMWARRHRRIWRISYRKIK